MEQYFINCENKSFWEVAKQLNRYNPYFAKWKRKQTNEILLNAVLKGQHVTAAYNNQGGYGANKFIEMFTTKLDNKFGIAIKIVYKKYGWPRLFLNQRFDIKEI